jgi:hypothetical protein
MTTLKKLILISVALTISAGPLLCARAQTGAVGLPPDIAEFLSRRASCSEWSKRAMDPEQTVHIEAIYSNLQSLKCFDIFENERALREKHAKNPEVLRSLGTDKYTKFVTRLPARIAAPPAPER